MDDNPIKKLNELKERAKEGIESSLFFIKDVERLENKGVFTKKDAKKFKKRYNNAIKDYEKNIQMIDKFFNENPFLVVENKRVGE